MLKNAYTINMTEWDFHNYGDIAFNTCCTTESEACRVHKLCMHYFFLIKCHECLPSVEQSCVSACNAVRGEAPFCSGCLLEPTEAASDCSRL